MNNKNLKEILIATGNKGKLKEFEDILSPYNILCRNTKYLNIDEPEENGKTFEENAIIKSQYYYKKSNIISLADDSGLCVDQLSGKPGIYSARWAGEKKDFAVAIDRVKKELISSGADMNNISGYFYCALSITFNDNKYHIFSGKVLGKITFPPRGDKGFGYDPIFIPEGESKTFAQLTTNLKERYSHRAIASSKLIQFLTKNKYINSGEKI